MRFYCTPKSITLVSFYDSRSLVLSSLRVLASKGRLEIMRIHTDGGLMVVAIIYQAPSSQMLFLSDPTNPNYTKQPPNNDGSGIIQMIQQIIFHCGNTVPEIS